MKNGNVQLISFKSSILFIFSKLLQIISLQQSDL